MTSTVFVKEEREKNINLPAPSTMILEGSISPPVQSVFHPTQSLKIPVNFFKCPLVHLTRLHQLSNFIQSLSYTIVTMVAAVSDLPAKWSRRRRHHLAPWRTTQYVARFRRRPRGGATVARCARCESGWSVNESG